MTEKDHLWLSRNSDLDSASPRYKHTNKTENILSFAFPFTANLNFLFDGTVLCTKDTVAWENACFMVSELNKNGGNYVKWTENYSLKKSFSLIVVADILRETDTEMYIQCIFNFWSNVQSECLDRTSTCPEKTSKRLQIFKDLSLNNMKKK